MEYVTSLPSELCRLMLQISSLKETVEDLYRENDSLVRDNTKLQQQIRMLEQQATAANNQVCFSRIAASFHHLHIRISSFNLQFCRTRLFVQQEGHLTCKN